MPLDNDTCDVKMPSLKGKAWAGANGDWVVYIGYNYEWELVNVYTRHRVPLPQVSECPEFEHTDDLRMFKYDHGDCLVQNIAICRVPNRSWDYMNYHIVAIFHRRQSPRSYLNVRRIPVCSSSGQSTEIFGSGTR